MMPPGGFQIGQRLTDAEIAGFGESIPDGVVAVWGADWNGRPVLRGVRSGYRTSLVGKFGEGFDGSGPSAILCGECGELLVVQASRELTLLHQQHLYREHGISAPLLP
ncbi:Uncharacterised protein [Mycobacteroides abscessus subsp. massiliense]|uniref:hypothetical protein n=1 Tax=Mycobacteroides abscessus TaxID=36809 RepID=UPI0009A87E16|nr:hypothetical protein [Mycobacteroides abscessus]SKT54356.1 Uncharacterised protein [Mycobacteroides abscessus subsp. massiliense]